MKKVYSKACVIGRFEPTMHNGHVAMVKKALEVAETVYILVGSASAYPDTKNPISFNLRQRCIHKIITTEFPNDYRRIVILPLNDYKYNDEKWKTEVRTQMNEHSNDKIAMVGFEKDEDSYWLKTFGWSHVNVEPLMVDYLGKNVPMSSTFIRDHWLRTGKISFQDVLPDASIEFLRKFTWGSGMMFAPEFDRLNEERLLWDKELKKFENYPYQGSLHACCADAVVVCNNHLLVIERKFAPGKGAWAIPGGHKDANETFRYAALRELEEEVKLKVCPKVIRGSIKGQELFDDPKRTAEFCKPTVAQYIVLEPNNNGKLPKVKADSDAKKAFWVPMHEVKKNRNRFFDDHFDICQHFIGF